MKTILNQNGDIPDFVKKFYYALSEEFGRLAAKYSGELGCQRGLLAFYHVTVDRSNNTRTCAPKVCVLPFGQHDAEIVERLATLTVEPRPANLVTHLTKPNEFFQVITDQERATIRALLGRESSEFTAEELNLLDKSYFKSDHIVQLSLPFLGSPIVCAYFDDVGSFATKMSVDRYATHFREVIRELTGHLAQAVTAYFLTQLIRHASPLFDLDDPDRALDLFVDSMIESMCVWGYAYVTHGSAVRPEQLEKVPVFSDHYKSGCTFTFPISRDIATDCVLVLPANDDFDVKTVEVIRQQCNYLLSELVLRLRESIIRKRQMKQVLRATEVLKVKIDAVQPAYRNVVAALDDFTRKANRELLSEICTAIRLRNLPIPHDSLEPLQALGCSSHDVGHCLNDWIRSDHCTDKASATQFGNIIGSIIRQYVQNGSVSGFDGDSGREVLEAVDHLCRCVVAQANGGADLYYPLLTVCEGANGVDRTASVATVAKYLNLGASKPTVRVCKWHGGDPVEVSVTGTNEDPIPLLLVLCMFVAIEVLPSSEQNAVRLTIQTHGNKVEFAWSFSVERLSELRDLKSELQLYDRLTAHATGKFAWRLKCIVGCFFDLADVGSGSDSVAFLVE